MYNFQGFLLPVVYDIETGETHQGVTAYDLSEAQGRTILPSYEGNLKPKSSFQSRNNDVK